MYDINLKFNKVKINLYIYRLAFSAIQKKKKIKNNKIQK